VSLLKHQGFSKHFILKRKRERLYSFILFIAFSFNVVLLILMTAYYRGNFLLGNIFTSLITLTNIVLVVIKIAIFDRALKGEE